MKNVTKYNKYLEYKKDILFFDKINLEELSKKIKTPAYCYSVLQIKDNFEQLRKSFKKINPLICYAVKANFNHNIIHTLSKLGAGADVVSKGELKQSINNGVRANKIVFSGVGKTIDELEFAIFKNIKQINVESEEELNDIEEICKKKNKKIDIGLRVNPNVDAKTHSKISTGRYEDKFGIPENRIIKIFEKFKGNNFLKVNSLSIHIGSQITTLEPFSQAFKKLRKLTIELKKKNFFIKSLDIGGGIGVTYNEKKDKIFKISSYVELVERNFSDLDAEIILEPGRYLVGESGILLSKVVRLKKGEKKTFLIIDAGMNNLIRPSLYNAEHQIFPVRKKKIKKKFDIVGPVCESSDVFRKDFVTSELKQNNLIIISSVGAYGSCMSSGYNLRENAMEILIEGKKIIGI